MNIHREVGRGLAELKYHKFHDPVLLPHFQVVDQLAARCYVLGRAVVLSKVSDGGKKKKMKMKS